MQIHEILENRKKELEVELAEIKRVQALMDGETPQPAAVVEADTHEVPKTKDEAIFRALEAGNTTPATIGEFIRTKLGLDNNPASTRTRLSRLKAAGKITQDGNGWKILK